ncbi:MAG: hypothetical protein ACK5QX_12515 [bacterium]
MTHGIPERQTGRREVPLHAPSTSGVAIPAVGAALVQDREVRLLPRGRDPSLD